MKTTHTLETAEVDIAYDVFGPLPTADGRPPLFMIGQPMDASGFATLASHFPDRTVVTYDPRGLGRSIRKEAGSTMRLRSRPTTCTPSSRRSASAQSRCSPAVAAQ
jgi:pimeloyl-ACP methyl ester carboxylesterase